MHSSPKAALDDLFTANLAVLMIYRGEPTAGCRALSPYESPGHHGGHSEPNFGRGMEIQNVTSENHSRHLFTEMHTEIRKKINDPHPLHGGVGHWHTFGASRDVSPVYGDRRLLMRT